MKAVPPKIDSVPSQQRWVLIILAAAGLGLAAILFFFNPVQSHFYPVCRFHQLTGLNCPGCGMTRAAYAVLHGRWGEALRDNALFVGLLAALLGRTAWFGWHRWCGRSSGTFFRAGWLWSLLLVTLAFTVLRNLPVGAFLAPS